MGKYFNQSKNWKQYRKEKQQDKENKYQVVH